MEDKFKGITKETLIKFIEKEFLDDLLIAFNEYELAFKKWSKYYWHLNDKYGQCFFGDYTKEEKIKYKRIRYELANAEDKYNKLKEQK